MPIDIQPSTVPSTSHAEANEEKDYKSSKLHFLKKVAYINGGFRTCHWKAKTDELSLKLHSPHLQ